MFTRYTTVISELISFAKGNPEDDNLSDLEIPEIVFESVAMILRHPIENEGHDWLRLVETFLQLFTRDLRNSFTQDINENPDSFPSISTEERKKLKVLFYISSMLFYALVERSVNSGQSYFSKMPSQHYARILLPSWKII